MSDCKHEHTGSCSPDGVYLYVTCMYCGTILAESDDGRRRWESCPGFEAKKYSPGSCKHCHRSAQQHYDALRQRVAELTTERNNWQSHYSKLLDEFKELRDGRLAEAEALIDRLCAHEGAEGWSEDLRQDLDCFYAQRKADSASVGQETKDA